MAISAHHTGVSLSEIIDQVKIHVTYAEAVKSSAYGRKALRIIDTFERTGEIDRASLTGVLRNMTVESPSVRARREAVDGYDLCVTYLPTAAA